MNNTIENKNFAADWTYGKSSDWTYGESNDDAPQYGKLIIKNQGFYIARFFISWEEVTCVANIPNTTTKYWENNCKKLPMPYSATIQLPMTAKNICIKAEEFGGNPKAPWVTILDRKGFSMVPERTVTIWGTYLDPHYSIEPQ